MTYARLGGALAGPRRSRRWHSRVIAEGDQARRSTRAAIACERTLREHNPHAESAIMNARRSAGYIRIERQIRAARLEDAEDADDHVDRALQGEADQHVSGPRRAGEEAGQPVRPAMQFAIGDVVAPAAERDFARS